MNARVTYHSNFFYYLMMPRLWIGGVAVYLGFGPVYVAYPVVKLTVIVGAYRTWLWDAPLYRVRTLRPLMWVTEWTISTPVAYWTHHALTGANGTGHYKDNFGNLLFFWDVLFSMAHITRKYPAQIGLQDDVPFGVESWIVQMFYPLVQSKREHSTLRSGGAAVTGLEMNQAASAKQEAA